VVDTMDINVVFELSRFIMTRLSHLMWPRIYAMLDMVD
jgi:hypothetical protein